MLVLIFICPHFSLWTITQYCCYWYLWHFSELFLLIDYSSFSSCIKFLFFHFWVMVHVLYAFCPCVCLFGHIILQNSHCHYLSYLTTSILGIILSCVNPIITIKIQSCIKLEFCVHIFPNCSGFNLYSYWCIYIYKRTCTHVAVLHKAFFFWEGGGGEPKLFLCSDIYHT